MTVSSDCVFLYCVLVRCACTVYLYCVLVLCACTVCRTVYLYHVFKGTICGLRREIRKSMGIPTDKITFAIDGVQWLSESEYFEMYDTLEDLGVKTGSSIFLCELLSPTSAALYVRWISVKLVY